MSAWRYGLYGLAAAWLLIAGWTINGWRLDAREAKALSAKLDAQIKATKAAEDARVIVSAQLAEAEGQVRIEVHETIKRVPVLVNDSRECDLDPGVVGLLNRARGYVP